MQSDLENLDGYAQDIRSDLDQEISDRIAGDSSLQAAVSAEESARVSAVSSEQAARIAGDSSLQAAVSAEESARISAVSSEQAARIAGDSSLQSQITNILSNIDPAALDSLTEIVSAFEAADSNLNGAIIGLSSSLQAEMDAEVSSLQSALSAEVSTLTLNKVDKAGDEMSGNLTMTGTDGAVLGSEGLEIYGNGLESPATAWFDKNRLFMESNGQAAELMGGQLFLESGAYNTTLNQSELAWNFYEGNSTSISRGEFHFISSFETETGVSRYIMDFGNGEMPSISQDLTGGLQNSIPFVPTEDRHIAVKKYVDDQDLVLSGRLDALEAQTFNKEKFIIDQTSELASVELAHEVVENSLVVCVGRLMVQKDEDYTVSVVDGKTVLTWIGDFATGEVEAIENGDVIFVTYAYSVV